MGAKQPPRKPILPEVQRAVLTKSRRRCALCFHLEQDIGLKKGQVAHLDRRRSNNDEDNLAWLCLDHHSEYDSTTSQHKNYTIDEVKQARQALYGWVKRGMRRSSRHTSLQRQSRPTKTPKVILTSTGADTSLRVESFGAEAVNVRLVPVESTNYRLRSEVVRCLRMGAAQPLILRCQKKGDGADNSSYAPSLFFEDFGPSYDGLDEVDAWNRAMKYLTEERLVLTLQIAYSNLECTAHYRSSFRVRWDPIDVGSIVDVEPIGTQKDSAPPPSNPPDVIR
jgi:hypothetical protein